MSSRWVLPLGVILAWVVVPAGVLAQQRIEYMVYDGQQYAGQALEQVSMTPHQIEEARSMPGGSYAIPRAADGHYYAAATLNGFPVVFMVDTGATHSAIPASMARNAGIRAGRVRTFQTAAGPATGSVSEGNTVIIGALKFEHLTVGVQDKLQMPLLGADLLDKLDIKQSAGFMVIKPAQHSLR